MEERTSTATEQNRHPLTRMFFLVAGTLSLALGIVGIVLPLLPTTPFLLLAAACYARGSERFYRWLLANRWFGPIIRNWREHRAISKRTKVTALSLLVVTFGVTIAFFARWVWLKVLLAAMALTAIAFVSRLRVHDDG